jgi:acetyl esterase/lipase
MTFNAVRPFTPDTPANPFIVLIMGGLKASHPEFDPSRYLTAYGMELLQKTLATDCYTAIAEQAAGKKSQELYSVDAAEAEELLQLLEKDGEIPVRRHAEPIFLAQGTADTVVFGPATTVTADQLRAVGNDLTFKVYPGVDHNGLMAAAKAEILAWAADRMR